MVYFVNKIELGYQKYQTNGIVIDEDYKIGLLFPMRDSFLFVTDRRSMYFMSTIFLKDNIDAVLVPQFQIS